MCSILEPSSRRRKEKSCTHDPEEGHVHAKARLDPARKKEG